MAIQKKYNEVKNDENYRSRLVLKIKGGQWIECEGFEDCYILNEDLPDGKYSYYCRHRETNLSQIESIKSEKGLTCNFWGCIVTDTPIRFSGEKDLIITRMINDTDNHDLIMVFGESAADAYLSDTFDAFRKTIENGDGQIVKRCFNTDAERQAYLLGVADNDGWNGSTYIYPSDIYKHGKAIAAML